MGTPRKLPGWAIASSSSTRKPAQSARPPTARAGTCRKPGEPDPGYVDLLRGSLASWQDDAVGWWNPEDGPDITGKPPMTARDILRIVRPPAAPTVTTPFKGRIESIGIGPAGIVAFVHSHLDWDAWVASSLGTNWVSRYKGVDFKDGILEITMEPDKAAASRWSGRTRASSRAITRTRASVGSAPMARSGPRSRTLVPPSTARHRGCTNRSPLSW